jgi:hypothetical protein
VLTENEVSAAPNPTMTATLWVAVREQEAGCGGSSRAQEEQHEGEKGKNGDDGAAPLLNGHGGVGDGWGRAPRSGKEWGEGVGEPTRRSGGVGWLAPTRSRWAAGWLPGGPGPQ